MGGRRYEGKNLSDVLPDDPGLPAGSASGMAQRPRAAGAGKYKIYFPCQRLCALYADRGSLCGIYRFHRRQPGQYEYKAVRQGASGLLWPWHVYGQAAAAEVFSRDLRLCDRRSQQKDRTSGGYSCGCRYV